VGGLLLFVLLGCSMGEQGVPVGKLAVVGPTVLGPEDVAATRAQLGAYGQLRFDGVEGERTLLDALIIAELLAIEARAAGLGEDPRVQHAVMEEIAAVELSTELQRRVPVEDVAADVVALRAHYDAHLESFTTPERRNVQGLMYDNFDEAHAALAKLRAGVELGDLGDVMATPLKARDDAEFPAFHPFLFDPALEAGALLSRPVVVGQALLVGRVEKIEPARVQPFEDPEVQERLLQAVRAPLLEAAQAELMAELQTRFPERPVD
jgi:hypothetical protein